MSVEIIAAIIGATVAAATTATQATIDGMNRLQDDYIGVITNKTPFHVKELYSAKKHGNWDATATEDITALPTPQTLFDAWKMSGEIPEEAKIISGINQGKKYTQLEAVSDLDKPGVILLEAWIRQQNIDGEPGTFRLVGVGNGVEGVVVYQVQGTGNAGKAYLCLYITGGGGGTWIGVIWAGCAIFSWNTMKKYLKTDNTELDGDKLMQKFREEGGTSSDDKAIVVSTNGSNQTAVNNHWHCQVTSGNISKFVLEAGQEYW